MTVKRLPTGGSGFRSTTGAGSFSRKLNSATRIGAFKNLSDNKEAVIKAIKKQETAIRRGNFNRLRQLKAMSDIKKLEGTKLTKDDKKDIKKIFKHLASNAPEKKESVSKVKIQKELDKDQTFKAERRQEMKNRVTQLNRTKGGGEAKLQVNNVANSRDKDEMSATAKLLERRFTTKEDRLSQRLPRARVNWEQEKEKRFEVGSTNKDMNEKVDDKKKTEKKSDNDKSKTDYQLFQNL